MVTMRENAIRPSSPQLATWRLPASSETNAGCPPAVRAHAGPHFVSCDRPVHHDCCASVLNIVTKRDAAAASATRSSPVGTRKAHIRAG